MPKTTIGLDKTITFEKIVRGGKPCLAGTRITVSDIVIWHFKLNYSVEQIAVEYDLPLTGIYSALAYYYDNKAVIDDQIHNDQAFAKSFEKENPSKLQAKLKALRGE